MIHGNLLKEPISGKDVIIIEKKNLVGLIDNFILKNIDNILSGKWLEEENQNMYEHNFKVIPYSSLGNENGLLFGFEPDYIKIYLDEIYIKNNIIIGIYNGTLSKAKLYTSLIGLNILEEEKNHGTLVHA